MNKKIYDAPCPVMVAIAVLCGKQGEDWEYYSNPRVLELIGWIERN
jgi:hypothetical protein